MFRTRTILILPLAIAAALAPIACATHPMKTQSPNSTILTGQWKGDLMVPEGFSSNRGMLDSPCDRESDGNDNIQLKVSQNDMSVSVEGHLRCKLKGKPVYSVEIPSTSLELKGEDLLQDGKKLGTATPVYLSMIVPQGKLSVMKYPTWEKILFETASSDAPSQVMLSGVFENHEDLAKEKPAPEKRQPANTETQ